VASSVSAESACSERRERAMVSARLIFILPVVFDVTHQVVEDELGELVELFIGHLVDRLLWPEVLLLGVLFGHDVSLVLLETRRAPLILRS